VIGFIKGLIKALLPLGMYLGALVVCVRSAAGRPHYAVFLIAILTPLPNMWYQIHQFPFGKDLIDLLVFSAVIGVFVGKHRQHASRAGWFLFAYMFYMYLEVWQSSIRFDLPLPLTPANDVFVYFKNYAEMGLLYAVAYHATNDEKHRRTLVWICMAVFFVIVLREARNFSESTSFNYDKRAAGPFWIAGLGPNHFAAFVVHFAAVALGLSFFVENKYGRWFLWITSIIALQPLFFAYSRGAYIAALLVIFVYGLLKKRALLVVLLVVAISWQAILPRTVVERITMTENSEGELESSAHDRVVLWDDAVALFKSSPVVGVGLSGFGLSHAGGKYTSVHNLYLETLAEQGIVGLLFLIAVMLRALFSGFRLFLRADKPFEKGLGLGFTGCVLAAMVTNIFGDRWSYFEIAAYFWIMWAVVDRSYTAVVEGARAKTGTPSTQGRSSTTPATAST
jgi:putative inorganic carbon (hco3(-)) transporter